MRDRHTSGAPRSRGVLQYVRRSIAFRSALPFALVGLLVVGVAVAEGIRTHRRGRDFYQVRAEIQAKYVQGGRGGPSYALRIRYLDLAGQQHDPRVWVSRKEYGAARRGDTIAVYVSGIEPDDAWPMSAGQPGYVRTTVLASIAAALFLPILFVLEGVRRRAVVLCEGLPVSGCVDRIAKDYRSRFSPRYLYRLTWSCTGPDGRRRMGKSLHVPKQLANQWKPGDHIEVFFHRKYPRWGEVDVYGLRLGGGQ